jgi:transglutaminase-like putative cysteine protease
MMRKATRMAVTAVLSVLLWTYGGYIDLQLFAVNAEARSAAGLGQLEQEVAAALKARSSTLHIDYVGDGKELSASIKDIIRDAIGEDEYTAYIVDSYFYSIRSWQGDSRVKLTLRYRESLQETAEVDRQIEEVLSRIVTPDMNAHQKVKAIHDWIVLRLAYDSGLERYTAYEALKTGKAVCQGYSLLAYRMLNMAGIPARIVEGKVESGDHAWNLVQLDGAWYHMDATWDDPVPDTSGKVRYDYYLKTDEEMKRDHSWTRSYPAAGISYSQAAMRLAEAGAAAADFYAVLERDLGWIWLKPEHTAATAAALGERVQAAAADGETKLTLRYLPGATVKRDLEAALDSRPAGVRGYKASYVPFGDEGAVLLTITLTLG